MAPLEANRNTTDKVFTAVLHYKPLHLCMCLCVRGRTDTHTLCCFFGFCWLYCFMHKEFLPLFPVPCLQKQLAAARRVQWMRVSELPLTLSCLSTSQFPPRAYSPSVPFIQLLKKSKTRRVYTILHLDFMPVSP